VILSEIGLSFRKEMTEVLRDKRTLLITLALPALMFPLIELIFALMANSVAEQTRTRITRVYVQDPKVDTSQATTDALKLKSLPAKDAKDAIETLRTNLAASKRIRLLSGRTNLTPEALILQNLCDVVITVPPTFSASIAAAKPSQINLIDNAYSAYMIDEQNVWDAIKSFADAVRAKRIAPFNIPAEETQPLHVSVKTVESDGSRSAYWAGLVYTLLVVFVMCLSSMYPALDVITGERERGTLILLLMAPGDRRSYVCGKLLTVTCITMIAALLAFISVTATLPFVVLKTHDFAGSFRLSLPFLNLFLSGVFVPPIAVAISASALVISSYAKTFQQGQSLFAPVILAALLLCGLVLCSEDSAPFVINLVPLANLALCMFRAIQGRWEPIALISSLLSSAVYLALLIRISVGILDREESLFGIKQAPSYKTSYAKEGFVTFAVCLAVFFYVMPFLQLLVPIWGMLLAQLGTIGLPAIMVPKFLRMPLKQTLSLVRPSIWSALGAVMLAPALALLSTLTTQLQSSIMPNSESYIKALQDYIIPKGDNAWTAYITIALAPAVCEELLFRGALQGMLRRSFSRPMLCSLIAIMFGIMHGSSFRFLPTALMGFGLAYLTEITGSIFPSMLLHACNNALAVYIQGKEIETTPTVIAVSVVMALLGIFAIYKGRRPDSAIREH